MNLHPCNNSTASTEELQEKLNIHLGVLKDDNSPPWRLDHSPIGGRGVFANRDIAVNELIFRDRTLIVGPRSAKVECPSCVMCHKRLTKLDVCKNGCALSICPKSECQDNVAHEEECKLIMSWGVKNKSQVSMSLMRCLTSVRGLLLTGDAKALLGMLQSNPCAQVVGEMESMSAEVESFPKEFRAPLYRICSVLNTNAFETKLSKEMHAAVDDDSLRGLYPLSCMMNHQCIPNVRYNFDDQQIMMVYAARPIKKDEEIFTSYLQLLWSTLSRRLQLKATKDFMCACPRCSDATECGTYISALKCSKLDCRSGRLLPVDALNIGSPWQCDKCDVKLEFKKVSRIQDVLSSVILKLKEKGLRNMQDFLKNTMPDILPGNNEYVLELKLFVIWRVCEDNKKYEFVDQDYKEKAQYCEELLSLLETMRAGECTIKGLLQFELYRARETLKKLAAKAVNGVTSEGEDLGWTEKMKAQEALSRNAWQILKDTVIEPWELKAISSRWQIELK